MTRPAGDAYVERIPETPGLPHRLGRHIRHDPRSAMWPVAGIPTASLASTAWTRRIPVLDQGQLGSCTGNAAASWLGTDDATRQGLTTFQGGPVDEQLALDLYSKATDLDDYAGSYPPDDTGSDGLSVAKALQAFGMVSSYQHAFSLQAALTALQSGPVLFGTVWYESMFDPDPASGKLTVAQRSGVAGGHEYVVDTIDVELQRIWLTNSWGESWGLDGRAYMTWADAAFLLGQQGDVTVPVPVAAPAPPSPTPPSPGGGPSGVDVGDAVRSTLASLNV
jgi:hypothetical protein